MACREEGHTGFLKSGFEHSYDAVLCSGITELCSTFWLLPVACESSPHSPPILDVALPWIYSDKITFHLLPESSSAHSPTLFWLFSSCLHFCSALSSSSCSVLSGIQINALKQTESWGKQVGTLVIENMGIWLSQLLLCERDRADHSNEIKYFMEANTEVSALFLLSSTKS